MKAWAVYNFATFLLWSEESGLKKWVALLCSVWIHSASALVIGLPQSTYQTAYQTQLEEAFKLLYANVEEQVTFEYLPHSRMLKMAELNQIGAIGFDVLLDEGDADIVRVVEPISSFSLYAGCLSSAGCRLTDTTRFAVVDDAVHANRACDVFALQCLKLASPELARKALRDGLADVHIMQRSPHAVHTCMVAEGVSVYPIMNTQVHVYHYLSPNNKGLSEELSARIKRLRDSYSTGNNRHCSDVSERDVAFDFNPNI